MLPKNIFADDPTVLLPNLQPVNQQGGFSDTNRQDISSVKDTITNISVPQDFGYNNTNVGNFNTSQNIGTQLGSNQLKGFSNSVHDQQKIVGTTENQIVSNTKANSNNKNTWLYVAGFVILIFLFLR